MIQKSIIVGISISVVTYGGLYYYFNHIRKNDKKNKDNKIKYQNEIMLTVSVLVGLLFWYVSTKYLNEKNNNDDNLLKINDIEDLGQNIMNSNSLSGKNINFNLSPVIEKTYSLVEPGLNVPKGELKLPEVLIDYD
jgi:hypothetical protein